MNPLVYADFDLNREMYLASNAAVGPVDLWVTQSVAQAAEEKPKASPRRLWAALLSTYDGSCVISSGRVLTVFLNWLCESPSRADHWDTDEGTWNRKWWDVLANRRLLKAARDLSEYRYFKIELTSAFKDAWQSFCREIASPPATTKSFDFLCGPGKIFWKY